MAWLTFDHLVRQFRELDYFRRDHLSSALDDIEANSIDPAKERPNLSSPGHRRELIDRGDQETRQSR